MEDRKKPKDEKHGSNNNNDHRGPRERYDGPVDTLIGEYFKGLVREREALDPKESPNLVRLIERELSTLANQSGENQNHVHPTVDLYTDPPITLTVKCFPPSKAFPKFNYAGRIIGPKGAYLKAIMRETMTKMVLLGQGVMKDKEKEQSLLNSGDPKYYHLNEEMHVAISVTAPSSEAYGKVAYAINCLKRQVTSDNKELLSLPWIVRVIQNGDGPPQAYMNQGPPGAGQGPPMRTLDTRRPGPGPSPPMQRRPRPSPSGGYALLPPPHESYTNSSQHYYESPSPTHDQYRRYTRDSTPPPRDGFYGEPMPRRSGSGRSPRAEYPTEKPPRSSGRSSGHHRGSRSSPPPPAYYDYPSDPTPEPYYSHSEEGRGASWATANYSPPKSAKGYSTASARYAPYQK